MKNTLLVLVLVLLGCLVMAAPAWAQNKTALTPPTNRQLRYEITERGAHHKMWERFEYEPTMDGKFTAHPRRYEELATGMHYREGDQWLETEEKIEILPRNAGAAAAKGPHKAIFPPELKTGVIELQTPEGQWLRSRVWGLAYYDVASGESQLLAEVQESEGQLVGDNVVLYPNAFTDFTVDVRYTYTRAGFEQDVVLRERPPSPEQFGLNPKTTRLQVLTEFVEAPAPDKQLAETAVGLRDQTLGFGVMDIISGKAFSADAAGDRTGEVPVAKQWEQLEGREFLIEQVPFEAVTDQLQQLPAAEKYEGARLERRGKGDSVLAGLKRLLPERYVKAVAPRPSQRRLMAKGAPSASPSFVMDYLMVASQSNYTFKGDATYLVIGPINLSETTTIEGGAVIKFNSSSATLNVLGTLNCETAPYRPAFLTAYNDSTIGEVVSVPESECTGDLALTVVNNYSEELTGYVWNSVWTEVVSANTVAANDSDIFGFNAGLQEWHEFYAYDQYWNEFYYSFAPTKLNSVITIDAYGNVSYSENGAALCTPPTASVTTALTLANGGSLHDLHFRKVDVAIATSGFLSLTNVQFLQCSNAIKATSSAFYAGNVLLSDVKTGFNGTSYSGTVQNMTYDKGTQITAGTGTNSLTIANSLITQVTNNGVINPTLTNSYKLASSVGIYQTIGGGKYYLTPSSTNRDAGTSGINAGLLTELATKTTYPPIAFTNATFSIATNFSPQAPRDTNAPDLGYHYAPLDYSFGGCDVNAPMTFSAGTAVGWFRTTSGWQHAGHGLHVGDTNTLKFEGHADAYCYFAYQCTVQEGLAGYPPASPGPGGITGWAASQVLQPKVNVQFTRFSLPAYGYCHIRDDWGSISVTANHCEFYGASVGGYVSDLYLTNCLVDRGGLSLNSGNTNYAMINMLQNCTFRGGNMYIARQSGNVGTVKLTIADTIFDDTTFTVITDAHANNSALTTYSFNAFRTNANRTTPQGANDVIVTNFNWHTSWRGSFYLSPTSPLINTGSVASAASIGLYHFTTQTNHSKEAGSRVDLGYHYVAVNSNGQSVDTDGDGLADYREDNNGNGSYDSAIDLANWQTSDTDYDGTSDGDEVFTYLTNPTNATSSSNILLGRWTFDNTNSWVGAQGQIPLGSTNVVGLASPLTNAAYIYDTNGAYLKYRDVESQGRANINCQRGTVRFWFKPDWSSVNVGGTGPQAYGTMIWLGLNTTNFWGITVLPNGNSLYLTTKGPGDASQWGTSRYFGVTNWYSNTWHQVAMTYSASQTKFYVDGQLVATDVGVTNYPSATDRANGFLVGTSSSGNQSRGTFEELETYNYELSATNILSNYQFILALDTDGDGTPDYQEDGNGNGLVDSGETDWNNATDLGLKIWITRPKHNLIIP